jgi:hypothetical protein
MVCWTYTTLAHADVLELSTICTIGGTCRVRVAVGDGPDDAVVSTFRVNRVGTDMRYLPADYDGSVDVDAPGMMYLDSPVVIDEAGAMRTPSPDDPSDAIATFTQMVDVDEHGHVTFFSGFVRASGEPIVRRTYVWGYPSTTVQNIGSIGGPRSPVASREPPPPQLLRGDTSLKFRLRSDAQNRCELVVAMASASEVGTAITNFRANRVGEDMRYYPSETRRGTSVVGGAGTYFVDLDAILEDGGAMHSPEEGDAAENIRTLNTAIALDERGFVQFFYGIVKGAGSSRVEQFLLWGYPPATLMVDSLDEGSEGSEPGGDRGEI